MSISVRQAIPRLAVAASLCLSVPAHAEFDLDKVQDPYIRELYAQERPEAYTGQDVVFVHTLFLQRPSGVPADEDRKDRAMP